jgi:hypothetical protein
MKTVVIFDQCGECELRFGVFDGDLSHLHNKYINTTEISDEDSDDISELNCNLDTFPTEEVKNGAKVIVCGFIP